MTTASKKKSTKKDRIQIRLQTDIKEDFEAVAAFRGFTPTALIHSYIVNTVRQAREESPQIFSIKSVPKKESAPLSVRDELSALGLKPLSGKEIKKKSVKKKTP